MSPAPGYGAHEKAPRGAGLVDSEGSAVSACLFVQQIPDLLLCFFRSELTNIALKVYVLDSHLNLMQRHFAWRGGRMGQVFPCERGHVLSSGGGKRWDI